MKQGLGLYSHVIPKLRKELQTEYDDDRDYHLGLLSEAVVFDCRAVPAGFIDDTGTAILEEMEQNAGENALLPHDICYFEFDDGFAVSAQHSDSDDLNGSVVAQVEYRYYYAWEDWDDQFSEFSKDVFGIICNGDRVPRDGPFDKTVVCHCNPRHAVDELDIDRAAVRLLGVIGLLREKLLIGRREPDPTPWLSAKRRKKGKSPASGERVVVTVNVPAVRYEASRSAAANSTHDSPCLHWRRGHWRTLHRGSEFEGRAWVKRCLVGDPDKGFVQPAYRLTHHMPMM